MSVTSKLTSDAVGSVLHYAVITTENLFSSYFSGLGIQCCPTLADIAVAYINRLSLAFIPSEIEASHCFCKK